NHAGPWLGLAAASVLFGLLHAVTPTYAVLATLMGGYLGGLWMATGNILAPIIVHALYDFVVLYYLLAGPGRSLWEKPALAGEPGEGIGPEPEPPGGPDQPVGEKRIHFRLAPTHGSGLSRFSYRSPAGVDLKNR